MARTKRTAGRGDTSRRDVVIKVGTFCIAVIGAITGVYSCFETRRVDVQLTARETSFERGRLMVGIVNGSQRAISITSGTVIFDGAPIGEVTKFVSGPAATDIRQSAETEPGASGLPFPIAGGHAFSGSVEWSLPEEGHNPEHLEDLEAYLNKPRTGGQPADGRLVLRLDHDPGGDVETRVRLGVGDFDEPGSQPGHSRDWLTTVDLTPERAVRALSVYSVLPDPAVATFQLWGDDPKPLVSSTRPVVQGPDGTEFALPPRLEPGRYSFAVTAGGRTVAVGAFVTPCPEGPGVSTDDQRIPSDLCAPDN